MRKLKLFTFLLALLASVGMMNAATAIYSGFTATAGCGGFSGEDHAKLVDGKFTSGSEGSNWTKWCADSQHKSTPSGESQSCHWVEFNSANPITVTGYILTTGNDNTTHSTGRNPKNWVIKAKLNANDAWTTIANVSNDNTLEVANFKDFSFNLSQAGTYKYFRFMVTSVKSGTCMQLCELRFEMNGERLQVTGYGMKLTLITVHSRHLSCSSQSMNGRIRFWKIIMSSSFETANDTMSQANT